MTVPSTARRVAQLALLAAATSCAGAVVRPAPSPPGRGGDAVLVLPGFGYGGAGEQTFKTVATTVTADGFAFYAPTYISRGGLADSRSHLQRFIRERGLDRFARLHIFAFIAGAWTVNPLVEQGALPNLATIVYDRSPLQERAPRIADDDLHLLTWIRYGSPVFDVARTPYPVLSAPGVKVGLLVETRPTSFIRKHERAARDLGPFRFECTALAQRHDDCAYLAMSHDELYVRFADVWPEMRAFIRTGRFTAGANRTPPTEDPLIGKAAR